MDTMEMIQEAYTRVADGQKRIDLYEDHATVKAYWVGKIIRIDIKEEQDD
jgi:hypothetical protein